VLNLLHAILILTLTRIFALMSWSKPNDTGAVPYPRSDSAWTTPKRRKKKKVCVLTQPSSMDPILSDYNL
jgi:hypothetical protein